MSEINIAFTATNDWLQYTIVSAVSILENADDKDFYSFYIISNHFDDEIKQKFLLLNKIKESSWNFIITDDKEFEPINNNWLGCSSYYRLKLPTMVKKDKILYLDTDIVVLKNLAELYNTDISEYYLAAVEDKELGMRGVINERFDEVFHNSGVMLLNLKKFREEQLEEKIYSMLLKKKLSDQDVINILCYKQILSLPLKYNIMYAIISSDYKNRRMEYEQAIKDPVIMHFSQYKPWYNQDSKFAHVKEWYKYESIYKGLK